MTPTFDDVFAAYHSNFATSGDSDVLATIKAYRVIDSIGFEKRDGEWVRKDGDGGGAAPASASSSGSGPTQESVHVLVPIGTNGRKKRKRNLNLDDPGTQDVNVDGSQAEPTAYSGQGYKPNGHEQMSKSDVVTMDVPLLIRLLEVAREEIKSDEPLHVIAERLAALSEKGEPLTMDDYESIVPVEKRISGSSNIPLNAEGEKLAKCLGKRLAEKGSLDVLISSPLRRAVQTADAIYNAAPKGTIYRSKPAPELQPWHLGDIEGKQPKDVKDLLKHYITHPDEVPSGKGADGEPAESFNASARRQLGYETGIYQDFEDEPTLKIGMVMHSRGMELLRAYVDEGCPNDFTELDTEDLLHPDDPEHASVLRWHKDKIEEIDLEDDDPLKPGVYLILHSLTDDDTDDGNEQLEKRVEKFHPPIEVHRAAKRAWDAGQAVIDVTGPLVESEGLTLAAVRKIADHFGDSDSVTESENARDAWGGDHAEKWALRVLYKYDPDQPRDANGEWGSGGGSKEPVRLEPSEKMRRALESQVRCGAKEQRIADEQERKVSDALGIPRTKDNSAFDLNNGKTAVELKTMLQSKNGKITMSKAALARKNDEIKATKVKAFTVVADKRSGATKYYYSKGVGSFRVSSMTPTTLDELRAVVRGR